MRRGQRLLANAYDHGSATGIQTGNGPSPFGKVPSRVSEVSPFPGQPVSEPHAGGLALPRAHLSAAAGGPRGCSLASTRSSRRRPAARLAPSPEGRGSCGRSPSSSHALPVLPGEASPAAARRPPATLSRGTRAQAWLVLEPQPNPSRAAPC